MIDMNDGFPKLTRRNPGHYSLSVGGVSYHVFVETGKTWSGSLGSHDFTHWYMVRKGVDGCFEKNALGHFVELVSASRLSDLRKKIARYFSPTTVALNLN